MTSDTGNPRSSKQRATSSSIAPTSALSQPGPTPFAAASLFTAKPAFYHTSIQSGVQSLSNDVQPTRKTIYISCFGTDLSNNQNKCVITYGQAPPGHNSESPVTPEFVGQGDGLRLSRPWLNDVAGHEG